MDSGSSNGNVRREDDGFWCMVCGNQIAASSVSEVDFGAEYERYSHSNKVRLNGTYTRAWDDDILRRDEDEFLDSTKDGISL
jgi:hypothetical protein